VPNADDFVLELITTGRQATSDEVECGNSITTEP
jgi:hypothetical protein